MRDTNIVAKKLVNLMQLKGLSQKELANQAGVWPQQVNSWIKGRDNISTNNLRKLSSALNVRVEELTSEAEELVENSIIDQKNILNTIMSKLDRMEDKLDGGQCTSSVDCAKDCMYQVMFSKFPWGVSLSDMNGEIIAVNEMMCTLTRHTREELMNLNADEIYVNKEDRVRLLSLFTKDDVVCNFETQVYRGDGNKIWISINMKRIEVHGQQYLITQVEDITELKKAMDQIL